jgi:prevent-host-death family protein
MRLYGLYSLQMNRLSKRPTATGAEEARKQLPALLAAAAQGRTTIITKHGRAVAAVVPAESIASAKKQSPITAIAGTGKGLWGKTSTKLIEKLRDEWSR